MIIKEVCKRFEQFCNATAPTKAEMAERLKISPPALHRYITGGRIPGSEILSKLNLMGCNINWLLNGNGEMVAEQKQFKPRTKPVPVIGEVECGIPIINQMSTEGIKYLDLYDVTGLNNPFIVIARGDSMSPYINNGDYLLCSDEPERIKNGKAVLVMYKTTPETYMSNAKLIKMKDDDDIIMLYSVNTKYGPEYYKKSEIKKIYKVMRVMREVK